MWKFSLEINLSRLNDLLLNDIKSSLSHLNRNAFHLYLAACDTLCYLLVILSLDVLNNLLTELKYLWASVNPALLLNIS